jgi:MFS family permease
MEKEILKYKLFYFFRYFGDALFYPFMSIYFVSKGLSERELGIVLAITPIVTVLANPFWNYIVKDSRISQVVLKIMSVIEGLLIIIIAKVSGFELFALLVSLIALICSPSLSIYDGFSATFTNTNKLNFTSLRIWGSIAYVIATTVAGLLILVMDFQYLFIISGVFFIFSALINAWIKPLEKPEESEKKPKRNFRALMKNRNFFKYLVFYTIVLGSVRVGDSFMSVYFTGSLGVGTAWWGILYSAFVFTEVLAFRFLIVHGNQYSEKKLIIIAAVLFAVRYVVIALDLPLPVILIASLLRGVSWGIIIDINIKYITKIVKTENITMALLIVTLLYSIYSGIGNILAGSFIENFGYSNFYILQTALILLGLVSFLVFTPKINIPQINE